MRNKSPNVRNLKCFALIADIMLLILVDSISYRAHALQLKADIFRGFKVTAIGSTSNVIEENVWNENECYRHLFEDLCTAITYNEVEKKCLKHYYGRILLEHADINTVTWIRGVCVLYHFYFLVNFWSQFLTWIIFIQKIKTALKFTTIIRDYYDKGTVSRN